MALRAFIVAVALATLVLGPDARAQETPRMGGVLKVATMWLAR